MDSFSMDNSVVLSEWPDDGLNHHQMSAMDLLHGSNPWMPAYGFQVPGSGHGSEPLLEKEDFLDSADAELFLHNSSLNGHYVYLETIQEETLDDLQSESDRSESRASPQGWLATDSESGSVIRISILEEVDSGSEREIACPAKRRRQDYNHLTISDDESSLSRSSSLLQFECLEKQCQDISSSSPSVFSNFSYDSLEHQRNKNVSSPDSLEQPASDTEQQESNYYKMLKIDMPTKKFYNATHLTNSDDSSESADSDETLETPQYDSCKSVNNLKTWRSFDCLNASTKQQKSGGSGVKDAKMSTENLSEDSGYSDNFCNGVKCNSIPNVLSDKSVYKTRLSVIGGNETKLKVKAKEFEAYDGDVHPNFTTNFGVSYQDLSVVDKYDVAEYRSPLIDRFMRNGAAKKRCNGGGGGSDAPSAQQLLLNHRDVLNIDRDSVECTMARLGPKINAAPFASVPNLQIDVESSKSRQSARSVGFDQPCSFIGKQSYFEESVCVSSVPSNLNLHHNSKFCFIDTLTTTSIAEKNWDIGDLTQKSEDSTMPKHKLKSDKIVIQLKHDSSSISSDTTLDELESSTFIREASYLEAMAHSIEMSDDERQKPKNNHKTTLAEFDQRILKAISETSVNSFCSSTDNLLSIFSSTPTNRNQKRNVISTPNLSSFERNDDDEEEEEEELTKSSIERLTMFHSSSTSGEDKKLLLAPTKSFSGSTNSKGVHFSSVVSEVNWRDDSESTIERESSYSLSSTPERELNLKSPQVVTRPSRMSTSQPELQKVKKLRKIQQVIPAVSQPDMGLLRRDDELDDDNEKTLATKNYVVKRYLSCDEGMRALYKRSPTYCDHAAAAPEDCASLASSENTVVASRNNNRRVQAASLIGCDAQHDDESPPLNSHASYTSLITQMERKKAEEKKKKKDKPKDKQTTAQRIGGFWHKFSHFRFSTRASNKLAKTQVKSDIVNNASTSEATTTMRCKSKTLDSTPVYSPTGQRYATKDDYIHIPLRGPAQTKSAPNNNVGDDYLCSLHFDSASDLAVRGKPPLPGSKLAPPRVIGISMKVQQHDDGKNIDPVRHHKPPRQHRPKAAEAPSAPPSGGPAHQSTTAVVATSSSTPMGLIETDLDTEVTVITSGVNAKTRSLMNLGAPEPAALRGLLATDPHHHHHRANDPSGNTADQHRPHKSMEFLLDKQNIRVVEPPENNLQKLDKNGTSGNVMLSEHELRVQRSLSRLTVPEWFKRYQQQRQSTEGLILPRKSYTANSTSALHNVVVNHRERWPPVNTVGALPASNNNSGRTSSFTSLSNTQLLGDDQQQQFVRWSKSSKVSSAASSPCQSTRSSFNLPRYPHPTATSPSSSLRSSFNSRAPYMGWRSQERLNRAPRTPAERLANSILLAQDQQEALVGTDDDLTPPTESLIEVTSAIAHFVNDSGLVVPIDSASSQETVKLRSRSVSPAGSAAASGPQRKCWMESSFVGTKPLDSPQTPQTMVAEQDQHHGQHNGELSISKSQQQQQQQQQQSRMVQRAHLLECP